MRQNSRATKKRNFSAFRWDKIMVINQVKKIVKETDSRPLTTNILKPKIHCDRDILNKNKKENTLREEQIKK